MFHLLLPLFAALAPSPQPPAPVVEAFPFGANAVAFLHSDGRTSISSLEDVLAGRVALSFWSITPDENGGPPVTLTHSWEAATGTVKVETDCRGMAGLNDCVKVHAKAVKEMQAEFPRLPPR